MYRRVFAAGFLTALAAVAGCGGPKLVPAGGVVTLDGEPVDGALVTFVAEDGGHTATGQTDTAGSFTMMVGGNPGALPGKYKVLVTRGSGGITGGEGTDPMSGDYVNMMKKQQEENKAAIKAASKGAGGPITPKKSAMMPPGMMPPGGGGMAGGPGGVAPPPKTDLPVKYANITGTDLVATVEPGGSPDIRLRLTTPPPAEKGKK